MERKSQMKYCFDVSHELADIAVTLCLIAQGARLGKFYDGGVGFMIALREKKKENLESESLGSGSTPSGLPHILGLYCASFRISCFGGPILFCRVVMWQNWYYDCRTPHTPDSSRSVHTFAQNARVIV